MIRLLLLLQQLYNLSDDALEYQLLDGYCFVHFAGVQHSPRVPDAKTIWRWRERLKQAGLMETIMAAVNAQLKQAAPVVHSVSRIFIVSSCTYKQHAIPLQTKRTTDYTS